MLFSVGKGVFKFLRDQRGEGKVWLCGMGLSLGLIMTIFLLYIIVVNGMVVFWPRRVIETTIDGDTTLIGEVVKKQKKRAAAEAGRHKIEWQFYTGNREYVGVPFKFVDKTALGELRRPPDIMKIERYENSYAIGYPIKLKYKDGREIEADDEAFADALAKEVELAEERREEIRKLAKFKIGAVNRKMEKLRIRIRAEERDEKAGKDHDEDAVAGWQREMADLEADYQKLRAELSEIEAKQDEIHLVYRIAGGQEVELATGGIMRYYYPNRIGFGSRLARFFSNAWHFLVEDPREANMDGGVFPAIFGTVVMTVIMCIFVTPFGVIAAVYIHEYARQGFLLQLVRVAVNNLAGVPSIVFGVFGLAFFVYVIGGSIDKLFFSDALPSPTFGTGGMLWASLTLALLTLPVVIVAAEESLSAVPKGVREASYACGASKWQTIWRVVLPASLPGIITGMILAMARGAGEVAPLMLVGVVKSAPELPVNSVYPYVHLEQKFMHLGFHIFDLGFHSPDAEAAKPMVFATTLLLIVLVVMMNLAGIIVRDRLRRRNMLGAF